MDKIRNAVIINMKLVNFFALYPEIHLNKPIDQIKQLLPRTIFMKTFLLCPKGVSKQQGLQLVTEGASLS